jgi:hypothetical protein
MNSARSVARNLILLALLPGNFQNIFSLQPIYSTIVLYIQRSLQLNLDGNGRLHQDAQAALPSIVYNRYLTGNVNHKGSELWLFT